MLIRSATFIIFGLFPIMIYPQLLHDYQAISSSGKIPAEFLSSSTTKYEIQKKGISNIKSKFERNTRDRFYLESSFYVDALMLSGKVLFNDPIGKYVNLVADELLKSNPSLRRQIRFYVVKSPDVNAFATERGSIFINIGLIARLDNEAQLAFVLAHEIIHYTESHVIDNYVVAQYVDDESGAYKQASRYEKMLAKSNYSQEQELEADRKGMELFMRSKYRASAAPSIMNILKNTAYPYVNFTSLFPAYINPHFTQDEYIHLIEQPHQAPTPLDANAASISRLPSSHSSKIDSKPSISMHPSLKDRQDRLQKILIKEGNQGYYFVQTKRQFYKCREIARFEMCQLFLEQTAYLDALYQIHTLLPQYPNEIYLKKILAKVLYGIVKYRLAGKKIQPILNYEYVHANGQALLSNIQDIDKESLNMITLTYLWSLRQNIPETYLDLLIEDLLNEPLNYQTDFTQANFQTKWIKEKWESLKQEPNFLNLYERASKNVADNLTSLLHNQTYEGQKKQQKAQRRLRKRGYRLGIDTLVIFGPVYYRIDKRSKHETPIQLVASEQQQANFYHLIRQSARKLGIKLYLLDSRSLKSRNPAEHFNDIARLYAWHEELLKHGNLDIICSNYDQVLPMIQRYGTPYFAHMGAISMRANFSRNKLLVAIPTLAAPPVWPVFLYLALRPNEASFFYTWVYDLQRHKRVMNKYNRMKMKTSETVLKTNIYSDLWQIRKEK